MLSFKFGMYLSFWKEYVFYNYRVEGEALSLWLCPKGKVKNTKTFCFWCVDECKYIDYIIWKEMNKDVRVHCRYSRIKLLRT